LDLIPRGPHRFPSFFPGPRLFFVVWPTAYFFFGSPDRSPTPGGFVPPMPYPIVFPPPPFPPPPLRPKSGDLVFSTHPMDTCRELPFQAVLFFKHTHPPVVVRFWRFGTLLPESQLTDPVLFTNPYFFFFFLFWSGAPLVKLRHPVSIRSFLFARPGFRASFYFFFPALNPHFQSRRARSLNSGFAFVVKDGLLRRFLLVFVGSLVPFSRSRLSHKRPWLLTMPHLFRFVGRAPRQFTLDCSQSPYFRASSKRLLQAYELPCPFFHLTYCTRFYPKIGAFSASSLSFHFFFFFPLYAQDTVFFSNHVHSNISVCTASRFSPPPNPLLSFVPPLKSPLPSPLLSNKPQTS